MIPFTKMHGLGNDYVYLDAFESPALAERGDLPALARAMSDRRFGVGSDGLILVAPPTAPGADARMVMFNADGSVGAMCGNGLRCVVRLVVERRHAAAVGGGVTIETASGLRRARVVDRAGDWLISADMAQPRLDLGSIPARRDVLEPAGRRGGLDLWRVGGVVGGLVSMGNPHLVSFADRLPEPAELDRIGPGIERHPAFPDGINVHVARALSRDRAEMVTWERGSGRTLACGTGACAVLVAGALAGLLDRSAIVTLPGGDLRIEWPEAGGGVVMTGPATEVYRGVWPG